MNLQHFACTVRRLPLWAAGAAIVLSLVLLPKAAPATQPEPLQQADAATRSAQPQDGFKLLSGGTFLMGSPATERQRGEDEVQHKVRIDPFYVDPHEVAQKDYEALMGANPSVRKGPDLPVENVAWLDCIRYCNAKSRQQGLEPAYSIEGEAVTWKRDAGGYRLLTEAEWEYACRAGTATVFNVGDRVHSDKVNFEADYPYLIEENYVTERDPSVKTSHYRGRTMEVTGLAPNAFGLHHMHGNVSEWVFDYYAPYEQGSGAGDGEVLDNPAGPQTGKYRVNRGGSWIDFGKHLRSAYRSAANPEVPDQNLGFRIARNAGVRQHAGQSIAAKAPEKAVLPSSPKVLVAYFSYSGNTARAAEYIARRLNADLFPIRMQSPYKGSIYEASQQDLNSNARPALQGKVEDMGRYDVVLLGYPTWWATCPMPVLTFLESQDFAGKLVLPFSSHGGTVWGDSVSDVAKAIPGAFVGAGFEFHYSGGRSLHDDIDAWLKKSGLLK